MPGIWVARPWENPELYQDEAALFQFDKVKTPTHLVQGGADVRVSYLEGETMERALRVAGDSAYVSGVSGRGTQPR